MARLRVDGVDIHPTFQVRSGDPLPSGLTFASVKISEGQSSGPSAEKLRPWLDWFAAAGIPHLGGYHWLRSDSSVASQAANYITRARAVGLDKPSCWHTCDWERTHRADGTAYPDPPPGAVEEWCRLVGAAFGTHRVAVYGAPWVDGFAAWRKRNPAYPLVLANYSAGALAAAEQWNAAVLQFDGTDGRLQGFAGAVDLNMVRLREFFDHLDPAKKVPDLGPFPFDPAAGVFSLWPLAAKPTLRKGATGDAVRYLQGVLHLGADGRFGPVTDAYVRAWQRFAGLTVDGVVGPKTWALIDRLSQSWQVMP